ncbi:PD40 domain-containing protein, partial [Candidatus Poribacteria bacterium]|nr:PD40 domain-containing protein [Candidatus Poribacteria bacterium]
MRRFDALLRRYWQLAALGGLFLLTIGIQSANAKLSGQIVSDQGDNFIRIMNMDGTQQVQITDGQGRVASPVWSPSGKKIAFSSNRVGSWSIYTINVDGTELRKLTSDRINDSSPDWSPDSQKIVYRSQGQIFVIDVEGGQPIQLTHNNVKNVYPAWSPRGDQIAYTSNGEIWIMDTDGNNAKQLTDRVGQSTQPAWSPDGNRIAYTRLDPCFQSTSKSPKCQRFKNLVSLTEKVVLLIATVLVAM